MIVARLTSKSQMTVPKAVREALGVGPGDTVVYRVEQGRVTLTRAPRDAAYLRLIQGNLAEEWLSLEDCEAYDDL